MQSHLPTGRTGHWLGAVFALSGVSALIYQLCWQRLIFQAVGVDIDSVSIVVSVFMLGLGTGALAGGMLADRAPSRALAMFAICEAGIGLFGLGSRWLIAVVGDSVVGSNTFALGAAIFMLLLIPTALMGATLPVLVAHLARQWGNVGRSIGALYFVNTLGATFGALLFGFMWFWLFGLSAGITAAALLNFAVSAMVWFGLRTARGRSGG